MATVVEPKPPVTWTAKPSALRRLLAGLAGTPGTLRVFNAASILAALVFALLGGLAVNSRSDALNDVQGNAEQLVRVQSIRTNVVKADATATNAFLQAGLEPPDQRKAYQDSLAAATRLIADASAKSPADAALLAEVNNSMVTYNGLVASARANNRQGFPVGAAYLRQASALVRSDVLPKLSALVDDDKGRVDAANASSRRASLALWVVTGVAMVPLLVAQLWLLVRTRRWINPGVALATATIGIVAGVAATFMASSQATADTVDGQSYLATVSLAQARTFAFDAKSAESVTLINRGSGTKDDKAFAEPLAKARDQIASAAGARASTGDIAQKLDAYVKVHGEVRALDDGGEWDRAVQLAIATDSRGANNAFNAFAVESQTALDAQSSAVSTQLADARRPLDASRWLVLAAGLFATVASSLGFGRRLREYR